MLLNDFCIEKDDEKQVSNIQQKKWMKEQQYDKQCYLTNLFVKWLQQQLYTCNDNSKNEKKKNAKRKNKVDMWMICILCVCDVFLHKTKNKTFFQVFWHFNGYCLHFDINYRFININV